MQSTLFGQFAGMWSHQLLSFFLFCAVWSVTALEKMSENGDREPQVKVVWLSELQK